jgi:hypothetical protein
MVILPVIHRWNLGGRFLQRFVMDNLTWGSVRALRDVVDVMHRTSVEIYEARKQAIEAGSLPESSGWKDILTSLSECTTLSPEISSQRTGSAKQHGEQ